VEQALLELLAHWALPVFLETQELRVLVVLLEHPVAPGCQVLWVSQVALGSLGRLVLQVQPVKTDYPEQPVLLAHLVATALPVPQELPGRQVVLEPRGLLVERG